MTEVPDRDDHPGELDLRHILRVLFHRKWLIAGVALLAGIAAAAYSLTKPNIYQSSAALIVRDPQLPIDQAAESQDKPPSTPALSVETLQILAESTETLWTLFENLWETQQIENWTYDETQKLSRFRSFQNGLSTELKRQQNRRSASAVELLPVIVLYARSQKPETAQLIANEWATIVESKSREIYTQGIEATGLFIGDVYKQSNDSLISLEQSLAETTLEAEIDLKKAEQETLASKITQLEDAILEIDIELGVNEIAIEEGRRRVAEQEIEGEWIGEAVEAALLLQQPYPFDIENLSDRARKILDLVEFKVAQKLQLREYRQATDMLAKQKEFDHYQTDIERILLDQAKAEDELPSLESALASLNARLETIPERIVLNKAITDDALWNNYLEAESADSKTMVPLKSESVNPIYHSTLESTIEMTSRIETLRGSIKQLQSSASEVKAKMNQLETEIDEIQQEIDRQFQTVEAAVGSIKLLRDDYLAEKNRVNELIEVNKRKMEEKKIRLAKRSEFEDDVRQLAQELSDSRLQIDQLSREVEKTKNVRTAIASKAETVALIQVTAENASRTGTAILHSARANPDKIGPERSQFVFGAMAAGLLACAFAVCLAEMLREP